MNSEWAFGGATADFKATHDGTPSWHLRIAGSESWAGATIAIGYGETDSIDDRNGSVTMRVWLLTTGTVTLAMEVI